MVALLGFTWGGTFLVTEIALLGLTPFWVAAARITFAAALMSVIWSLRGFALFEARPDKATLSAVVAVSALSSAVPFGLLAWGQQYVTSSFAGVSMASVALIMLPLAHFFVPGEGLTLRRGIGFSIGFAGVFILIGGQAFETTGAALETYGQIACIGAACCYACSSIVMRRLPNVDTIGLATVLLLIASVMVLPVALIVEGIPPLPDQRTLIVVALLGLIPTAAANLLRVRVVRTAGPVFMSLTNYQVPVWSVVLGWFFLNEPLPASLLLAMVFILAGVAISQFGRLKQLFRSA